MNSYQNKKRKRNLAKKAKRKHILWAKRQEEFFNWFRNIEYEKLSEIMFEEMLVFGETYIDSERQQIIDKFNIAIESCKDFLRKESCKSMAEDMKNWKDEPRRGWFG